MARQRRGFTLIELLVVIAIIAIMIGLLTPAVQKVRATAVRNNCLVNLKQIALAMQLHHDTHGTLPRAVTKVGWHNGTWQVAILPFIEQNDMFNAYQNFGQADAYPWYNDPPNDTVAFSHFKILTCPADTPNAPRKRTTSHNYVVNLGNTGIDYWTRSNFQVPELNGVRFQGAPFGWMNAYRLTDFKDGTSNTMMVSELIQGKGRDLRGFTWWGGATGFTTYIRPNSLQPDIMLYEEYCDFTVSNPPCTGPWTETLPMMQAARSLHVAGVHVALCDGSTRFVTNSISLETWRALSTTNGSEVLGDY